MRSGDEVIRPKSADVKSTEMGELIRKVMSSRVPASRVLELLYWSQEPGALEMLRSVLALPAEDSSRLLAFLAFAEPSSVSVRTEDTGRLVITAERRVVRTGRKPHVRSRNRG